MNWLAWLLHGRTVTAPSAVTHHRDAEAGVAPAPARARRASGDAQQEAVAMLEAHVGAALSSDRGDAA
ncbi:MAG: hypothetical protein R2708_27795 [Vicinamibacterales bacterium]